MTENKPEQSEDVASTAAKIFDAFYSRFLLRDIVGKVVPGAILILLVLLPNDSFREFILAPHDVPPAVTIMIVAICWLTALSVQGLISRFSNFYFVPSKSCAFNTLIEHSAPQSRDSIPQETSFERRENAFISSTKEINRFLRVATPDEKAQYERFVVIKEACGNAFYCLVIGLIFVTLNFGLTAAYNGDEFRSNSQLYRFASANPMACLTFAILLLLLLFSMFLMHKDHVSRQSQYASAVLSSSLDDDQGSNQRSAERM